MTVVLSVYNAYLNRGGEDEVFDAEADLLERYGHTVLRFRVEADELRQPSVIDRARLSLGTIWSQRYFHRFYELLSHQRPDVVHFHNTFPLISPSAYRACKKAGVPVVQTLHNYRLVCPNAVFFREGHPCEDCLGRTPPWPGVLHACYHGSRAQTAVVATMLTAHRVLGTWLRDVDLYIALTEFSRQKFVEGGLPGDRIVVKPNFFEPDPGAKAPGGDFFLFVGRLVEHKGLQTLLRVWAEGNVQVPLRILGDGPLASAVERAKSQGANIQYLGRLPRSSVIEQMHAARALIVPSEWYEGFGMTIVEAFACGLPVIASRIGAMAEIIDDGQTGLLFAPGDVAALSAQVQWACDHPQALESLGYAGRRAYEAKYRADTNYQELTRVYSVAMDRARGLRP